MSPEVMLRRLYKDLTKHDTDSLVNNFVSSSINCFRELQMKIGRIKDQIKNNHADWDSEQLFKEVNWPAKKVVRDIFVELFTTGKSINSGTKSSVFKINPDNSSIEFKLPSRLSEVENINFFERYSCFSRSFKFRMNSVYF